MKTTIDRHRARLERARKRVEAEMRRYGRHDCRECARLRDDMHALCCVKVSLWSRVEVAIGRRKEAESVLREARRHG